MSLADALPTLRCSPEPIRYNDPEVLRRAEVQRVQEQQLQARLNRHHRSVVDQLTGWWRDAAQHQHKQAEEWACLEHCGSAHDQAAPSCMPAEADA